LVSILRGNTICFQTCLGDRKVKPFKAAANLDFETLKKYVFDKAPKSWFGYIQAHLVHTGNNMEIKMYVEVVGKPCSMETLADEKQKIVDLRLELEKAVMQYCYRLLGVEFPDRGFLLFWQLPLADKMKYFEIEEQIVKLKNISDIQERKKELDQLLLFLGANPVEKIDNAFKEKYGKGVIQYLELTGAA